VIKVPVKVGDNVKKGTPVCVIEALKMENDVVAPADGVIASINVKSGDSVSTDEVLLTMN
jgi:biotin carboxyl carrier protein